MENLIKDLKKIIDGSNSILIIQGNNPDGDSLASTLALEQILFDLGKQPYMYCGMQIPSHLRYLPGWDRVEKQVPKTFDCSIIVDCSAKTLLESAEKSGEISWIASKPTIIIDHHDAPNTIDFANVVISQTEAVSTGEVIYKIAKALDWKLDISALNMIAISILSDSLGLMSQATTSESIRIIADLVDLGVDLPELDNARRELMRKSVDLIRYKGELLGRIEYSQDNLIASITIPWDEIEQYSSRYNPSMLVIDDMRLTEGTGLAIAYKLYPDGKITAKLRANFGFPIANKIAEHFGGGGHPYAAGFKIFDKKDINDIKREVNDLVIKLVKELKK